MSYQNSYIFAYLNVEIKRFSKADVISWKIAFLKHVFIIVFYVLSSFPRRDDNGFRYRNLFPQFMWTFAYHNFSVTNFIQIRPVVKFSAESFVIAILATPQNRSHNTKNTAKELIPYSF